MNLLFPREGLFLTTGHGGVIKRIGTGAMIRPALATETEALQMPESGGALAPQGGWTVRRLRRRPRAGPHPVCPMRGNRQ